MNAKRSNTVLTSLIGGIVVILVFVFGMLWMGDNAKNDTMNAARSVSRLYLDELAGRREQVVEGNLNGRIRDIRVAIGLMTDENLSDMEHLRAYQARMKRLYNLEKFAFVDTDGTIYTSLGTQTNIDEYQFDYRTIMEPEISILNLHSADKKVIIAVPAGHIRFMGRELAVCFMEIGMDEMLRGVSMHSRDDATTFCNIYTSGGVALSNTVLGGLTAEDIAANVHAHPTLSEVLMEAAALIK